MPSLVGGEGGEVFGLEVGDEFGVELCVFGHCVGLAVIVSSMSEYLSHMSI